MKTCIKCNRFKSLSEFYRHSKMADGHLGKCKQCCCIEAKVRRATNIEDYRERDRERNRTKSRIEARQTYAQTLHGKLVHAKAKAKWRSRNGTKRRCHEVLGNAVRDGHIAKQPCEVCGSQVRIHGHHDDYNLPLVVRWLCPKHHREVHEEQKAA